MAPIDQAAEEAVDDTAPAAVQAGAADDRGCDRVEHELPAVDVRRHAAQLRAVDDPGDAREPQNVFSS